MRTEILSAFAGFLALGMVAGMLILLPEFADATALGDPENLRNLPKVAVVIDLGGPGAASEGLTQEVLRDEVIVLLRAKLPRLSLMEPEVNDILGISVTIGNIDERSGYYGGIAINLFRAATIKSTGQVTIVSVWHGIRYFKGPRMSARSSIRESLDEMLTKFASDWYRGNP